MALRRFPAAAEAPDLNGLAQRMERIRLDGASIAFEHTNALLRTFEDAAILADQVANGGESYAVGVREVARRSHIDLSAAVLNLQSIVKRAQ